VKLNRLGRSFNRMTRLFYGRDGMFMAEQNKELLSDGYSSKDQSEVTNCCHLVHSARYVSITGLNFPGLYLSSRHAACQTPILHGTEFMYVMLSFSDPVCTDK
jgi:hypothetical protein